MDTREATDAPPRVAHPLLERLVITTAAVAASTLITALFSLAFHARVQADFLVTGFSCSAVVAWVVIARLQLMRQRLATALERERILLVRAEKLRTLQQTMAKVQHHVNNLAANLQLVEAEYEDTRTLSASTLAALGKAIAETGQEMKSLGDLDDPFDDRAFEVRA